MKTILEKRFQLQLLFALIASISVAVLTVELVANAIRHAESFVVSDTIRTLNHPIEELDREYPLRLGSDTTWSELPTKARDLTLRGISRTDGGLSRHRSII